MAKQTKNVGNSDNKEIDAAPKKGRRKAPPTKANTRTKRSSGGANAKLIGQASKALEKANKFLSKIKV